METFFEPVGISATQDSTIQFINFLEGIKTRLKDLHFSATEINIHKQLDVILDTVSSYQDTLAEGYQGINGQFPHNTLNGVHCECFDPLELLDKIISKTLNYIININSSVEYSGLKSETETFIHNLYVQKYLLKQC